MMLRVACLPSNQHTNAMAGLPGKTEEKWAVAVYAWAVRRLNERGADARLFHVPGKGAKSTDELANMLRLAVAWNPDYMLSVHSDAIGDAAQTGVLMLMARWQDEPAGAVLGHAIAERIGLPYKDTWVYGDKARKVNYLTALREHDLQGCLVEVGEHATVREAAWNWEHIRDIGLGIADVLADYLGLTKEDDMLIATVTDKSAAREAHKVLAAGGILSADRPADDAASVGLMEIALARLLVRLEALEKRGV